ncbi:pyridoxal phosphate-dependent aminotransferase [Ideonella sp. DXS29W]|uniref:Aminotransferase n=1 Tax=Ideonella lacteola TaxID=2984193 RepID=A0ABU9BMZ3_9BURK
MSRFPPNDIIHLVGDAPRFDLAESLGPDLRLGDLLGGPSGDGALPRLSDLPLGYGTAAGDAALRHEIALAHGVTADDVVVTTGGMQALFTVAFTLCDAQAEAVAATPLFPLALNALVAVGATVRHWPLSFDHGYQPDLERLVDLLSPSTRLVSMASPQNPSGVAIPMATLQEIVHLVERHAPQAHVLIDETYRQASYGAAAAPTALALGPRVISTGSLSKCHGAPGLRIGWAITRDAPLRQQLVTAKFNTAVSCGRLDEALALHLLRRSPTLLAERAASLAANLDVVARWARREAEWIDWIRPDAGALCCVRLKPGVFDDAAVERFHAALPAHEVRVGDGRWFGESARVFRLGFGLLTPATLAEALNAVAASWRAALAGA